MSAGSEFRSGRERIVFFIDLHHDHQHGVSWPTLQASKGYVAMSSWLFVVVAVPSPSMVIVCGHALNRSPGGAGT